MNDLKEICEWRRDEVEKYYKTSCGTIHSKDYTFVHNAKCPNCDRHIVEITSEPKESEAEIKAKKAVDNEELAEKINARCQKIAHEFSEQYDDEAPLHEQLLANFARHLSTHLLNSLPEEETCEWKVMERDGTSIPYSFRSNCGIWFHVRQDEEIISFHDIYCPHCGRRIVESR